MTWSWRKECNVDMKSGIHPNYKTITVTCTTCGSTFESGSVLDEIRVEIVIHSSLVSKYLLRQMDALKSSISATA